MNNQQTNQTIIGIPDNTGILPNVLEANNACIERQRELIRMLGECRQQFLLYAESHLAKGTEDGDQKAATNQGFADKIDQILHRKEIPGG